MAVFDNLVSNLSQVYCQSNPETIEAFAPADPVEKLYHLIWTFLFIDQEFRNPRARTKVTCTFFVKLLQREGGGASEGYPRHYFDKQVLKNIYNDIRARPLLPAPHLIRALQDISNVDTGQEQALNDANNPDHGGGGPNNLVPDVGISSSTPRARHLSNGSFRNLAGAIKLDASFKRVIRWWRIVREESDNELVRPELSTPIGVESQNTLETSSANNPTSSPTLESVTTGTNTALSPPSMSVADQQERPLLRHSVSASVSNSSTFTSPLSIRSVFGRAKSELALNKTAVSRSQCYISDPIFFRGYSSKSHGWHAEGDGLDRLVRFPHVTRQSRLGSHFVILQAADLMEGQEPDDL
ncbi:hypothetical protein BGZ94_003843 [Podila epigama]|nr:hypothetical protein BGZ94_003843 [Podila epigama]